MMDWHSDWNAALSGEQVLHVRWMLNPGARPLRNVQLVVSQGHLAEIRQMPDHLAFHARPLALIPPLVNAHTHLEFSALRTPLLPAAPFTEWIRAVMRYRNSSQITDPPMQQVLQGLDESYECGVRAIAEISTDDDLMPPGESRPTIVNYREWIGLRPQQIDAHLAAAADHVARLRENRMLPGISPHAPYSVHPDLLDGLVRLASREHVPLAMHLAETLDEVELLQHGTGDFRDFLDTLGLWDASIFPGGKSVLNYLQILAAAPQAMVIHGNYLNQQELRFLASQPQLTTVYCPRTHHFFGHRPHPWQSLLRANAPVALGTDSRASNPDLNIWKELQFAARQTNEFPAERLLSMITTNPAEAMGLDCEHFRIRDGRPLSGVLLDCSSDAGEAAELLIRSMNCQPTAAMDAGVVTALQ